MREQETTTNAVLDLSKTDLFRKDRAIDVKTTQDLTPSEHIKNSERVAEACKQIVERNSSEIGYGKSKQRHINVEGWQAIAIAHGCFTSSGNVRSEYDQKNNLLGFSATGYVRRGRDGMLLAQAEGYAGRDEHDRKWCNKNYAVRGMAQTRAISRACRAAFAHIIDAINKTSTSKKFATTPYEEMPLQQKPPTWINDVEANEIAELKKAYLQRFKFNNKDVLSELEKAKNSKSLQQVRAVVDHMKKEMEENLHLPVKEINYDDEVPR